MNAELKSLFTKLNPVCHKAFEFAADLCVVQGYYTIEIEHLLQKLLDQSDTDIQVILREYDISIPKLKWELARAVEKCQRGNERTLSLAPATLTLLREAWLMTSLQFDSHLIRSGAILLALLEPESLHEEALKKCPSLLKIPRDSFAQQWHQLIKQSGENQAIEEEIKHNNYKENQAKSSPVSATSAIDSYTIDLTHQLRSKPIDPIVGRENEIRQIINILTCKNKNNIILIGDNGVGKTTTLEGVALKIAKGEVPPTLQNVSVRLLDRNLISQPETLIENITQEMSASLKPMIWFIDDIQNIIGGNNPLNQLSHLLKPALERKSLRLILATNLISPPLLRHFQVIHIKEPSEKTAIAMLRHRIAHLEKHHEIRLTDEAVSEAVRLSHRYLPKQRLPEKAINLLDTACAQVSLAQNGATPQKLECTLQQMSALQAEWRLLQREQSMGHEHKARLEQLMAQLKQFESEKMQIEAHWQIERDLVSKIRQLEASLISPQKKTKKEIPPLKTETNNTLNKTTVPTPEKTALSKATPSLPRSHAERQTLSAPETASSKEENKPLASSSLPSKEEKGLFTPAFLRKKKNTSAREQKAENQFSLLSFNKKDTAANASSGQENENTSSNKSSKTSEGKTSENESEKENFPIKNNHLVKNTSAEKEEGSSTTESKELLENKIEADNQTPHIQKDEKHDTTDVLLTEESLSPHDNFNKDNEKVSAQTEASRPLQTELKALKEQLAQIQGNAPLIPAYVDGQTIANVIADWTGLPLDKIRNTDEINTLLHLKEKLSERIISQPQMIETLSLSLQTDKAALDNQDKPKGLFLLVGPPGVGKTETAKSLAEILYNGAHHLITLNLSDNQITPSFFPLSHALSDKLDPTALLVQAVQHYPNSVLLIKHIEKASSSFKALFQQVFEQGRLSNDEGVEIDFKKTLILFTSELGSEELIALCQNSNHSPELDTLQQLIQAKLLEYFQAEWLKNLILLPYHPLNESAIREIIELKLSTLQKRCQKSHHAQLTYDENLINSLVKRCSFVENSTHQIDSILKETLLPGLSREILEHIAKGEAFSKIDLRLSSENEAELVYEFTHQTPPPSEEETEPETEKVMEKEESLTEELAEELIEQTNERSETLPDSLSEYNCHQFLGDLESVLEELKGN
jgi:ATP-dependent Clp protease ATP-binding subunit ClpA